MLRFYKAIWRATWRKQIPLVFLSVIVAALVAVPLKLQQLVVNELVYDKALEELLFLCSVYLAVVLLGSTLKFLRNYKLRILAESVVRRMRTRLYGRHVADTVDGRTDVPKRGTLLSMIASDAEDVGGFAGSAIADPLLMMGTLVSVIGFIIVQQPLLGLVALGIILPQAVIVFALQKHINRGVKKRVQILRAASDRIHGSDLRQIDEGINEDFQRIFETRRRILLFKLSSKFALRVINSTGVVVVLFLGGWLVLEGRTDVGTVVAALAGLSQISGPWIELVAFFRKLSTMQVRFDLITDKMFHHEDQNPMLDEASNPP